MSDDDPFAAPRTGQERSRPSPTQITLGAVLILIGGAWLLAVLDVAEVPWRGLLAAVLIVVGLAVAATSTGERQGGLVAIGVIITVLLALASTAEGVLDAPFAGGIGGRDYRPHTVTDLQSEYRLLIGDLDVDLRSVAFPEGETGVEVSVMIGQAVVHVPDDVTVTVNASLTGGEVVLFGELQNGFAVEATHTDTGYAAATRRLRLDVTGGFGRLEVE